MPRTKLDAGLRELRMQMKQVGSRVEDSIQSFEFTIYTYRSLIFRGVLKNPHRVSYRWWV